MLNTTTKHGLRTFVLSLRKPGIAGRLAISFVAVAVLAVVANLIVEGKVSVLQRSRGGHTAPSPAAVSKPSAPLQTVASAPIRPPFPSADPLLRALDRIDRAVDASSEGDVTELIARYPRLAAELDRAAFTRAEGTDWYTTSQDDLQAMSSARKALLQIDRQRKDGARKLLPLTRIKLDRSLVASIDTSARSASIARAIIQLCQGLGLSITAERIERPEQLTPLVGYPGLYAQGYLIAHPQSPDELLPVIARLPELTRSLVRASVARLPETQLAENLPFVTNAIKH